MNRWGPTSVTLLAALAAIAVPVWMAIDLSSQQDPDAQMDRALGYARDVLHRTESTARQANAAFEALSATGSADPCSPANIALMRKFDIGSTYLQAVGYIQNDRLICSSLGRSDGEEYELGPVRPEWIFPSGVRLRQNVRFPFDPRTPYIVVSGPNGYAALINRELALDATTNVPEVSLASFGMHNGLFLAEQGSPDLAWAQQGAQLSRTGPPRVFIDNGNVVAIVVSERFDFGSIAAYPLRFVGDEALRTAKKLVPVGLVAGILMALAMLYLRRLQAGMPAMLRNALRRDEFFLVYQPIVDLRTNHWVGAEALIRWRRRDGEMIRPDLFIPAAEDLGFIQRITRRVFELAARDLEQLFVRHPELRISFNLSASDLKSHETVAALSQLATSTSAAPGNLVVEITERGLIDPDPAREILQALRATCIRVAVDDFGTGYSSLAQLEAFDLDYLKIDKLFVDTMRGGAPTSQVALHIIEMARSLNLELIAEGVEDERQARFLRDHGVQYAQGWLFGRPMTIHELVDGFVRSRRNDALAYPFRVVGAG